MKHADEYGPALARLSQARQVLRKAKDGDHDIAAANVLTAEVAVICAAHRTPHSALAKAQHAVRHAKAECQRATLTKDPRVKIYQLALRLARQKVRGLLLGGAYWLRRLAVLKTKGPLVTEGQWEQIKRRYEQSCAYCGEQKPLTRDHVVALSQGGQHTQSNIIPACKSCNSKKGNRPVSRYSPRMLP